METENIYIEPEEMAKQVIEKFKGFVAKNHVNIKEAFFVISPDIEKAKQCAVLYCEGMQAERKRAVAIAYAYYDENIQAHESKKKAGNNLAFVSYRVAEECRHIGNAISGHNALSVALKEKDYWEQVKDCVENYKEVE